MKALFLLKNEAHESLFEEVNTALAEKNQAYLQKFGAVDSQQWFANYAKGDVNSFVAGGRFFPFGQKRTKKTD